MAGRFGDTKSYRIVGSSATGVSGLPDFFSRADKNSDGQVMMDEFSSTWNADTLTEFLKWDLNNDGVITAKECKAALERGARVGGATSVASSSSSSASSQPSTASASSSQAIGGTHVEWATRQIEKYDQNGDGQLTANEWEKMIIKPVGADTNGDGVLTVEEYAAFRAQK